MTICRYFLQGTCRYGSRCRYEHVYPNQHVYGGSYGGNTYGSYRTNSGGGANLGSNYGYGESYSASGGSHSGGHAERGGMSILRAKVSGTQFQQGSSIFGLPSNTQGTTQYTPSPGFFSPNAPNLKQLNPQETKEILQMIINEFTIWEHSGLWPLSCFSLFRGQSCFPGLIDYSPEEIRWFMYQARLAGNFEECQQYVKELYHKSKVVKEQFMTPNTQVMEILTRLSLGEKIETPVPSPLFPPFKYSASGNVFQQNSGGSVVAATPLAATPLAAAPAASPANSFTFAIPNNGQPANTNQNLGGFGASQMSVFANSVFTPSTTTNTRQNVFGGSSQNHNVLQTSSFHNNDSVIYTPMADMTEEMKNAFNSPVYTMGSVPITPPPKELCVIKR